MSSAQNSKDVLQTYNARNTILQLLEIQGYNVSDYENFSINEVSELKDKEQQNMLLKHNNKERKAYVCFLDRVNNLKDRVNELYDDEEILVEQDMLIIICPSDIPETLNKTLNNFFETGKFIVAFSLGTLQYNILNHIYVPKHTILSSDEQEEVMLKYNITEDTQFPTISRFDAVAKAIGMRPKELCKIERSSNTSIVADYYRLCTK